MNEKSKMSKNTKLVIAVLACVVLIGLAVAMYTAFGPKTSQGEKAVTITVVDDQGEDTSYETNTDAEYLQGAMEDAEGLTFSGEESDYGLMVDTVNGVTADYDKDGAYWSFYVNGEYCNYGIGEQPVEDGDEFAIEYTTAQ